MPYVADRVKETTTVVGTGAATLAGAVPDYRSFASAFPASPLSVSYCIDDEVSNWEVGKCTFNGTQLLRDGPVFASSNANALVSFSAGSKKAFCPLIADHGNQANIALTYVRARGMDMP
jgi:hypothetical protein